MIKGQRNSQSSEKNVSENRCNISSCQLIITSVRCITFLPVEILRVMTRKKMHPIKTLCLKYSLALFSEKDNTIKC
jgi:hypothetical protein